MNFDYWLGSIGPYAYRHSDEYIDEWNQLIKDWEEEQSMKCLVCGSWDVSWVQTVMHNEDEGYEEYSCGECRSRSEYGIKIIKREYTGKDDVCPYEQG
jgi:uncharacterized protein YecE (DUF72 family)